MNYNNELVKFTGIKPFWFTDMIENGQKLTVGDFYIVNQVQVNSSSTIITLKETGDLRYSASWFETVLDLHTEDKVKVTIDVTQKDIEEGQRKKCDSCPVTLAAKRVIKGVLGTNVTEIYSSNFIIIARLPVNATFFVMAFDSKAEVVPFSFKIEVPSKLVL